jgi:cytochrome P450
MTEILDSNRSGKDGGPVPGYDNGVEPQRGEPQPRYRAMLEEGPAVRGRNGRGVVAVRREAVNEVLRHPDRFTSKDLVHLGNVRPLLPLSVDPPDHLKYRRILDPLFAPRRMDAVEADIAARVHHFIDAFADRGECDFAEEFAVPFPSSVFLGLMGLPWEELDTFLRFKDGLIRPGGHIGGIGLDPAVAQKIQHDTGQEVYAYFNAILDERQREPRPDVLTQLLAAEVEGQKLTREEILDICFLFLTAGLDTVTDSLTCFYAFLSRNPAQRQRLVEEPAIVNRAVEELLRWETPVTGVPRMAAVDTEVAGIPVKAGEPVSVSLGAANLDPDAFEAPHEVRLDREENPHIAFGGGVHRCLGSHLARRELRVTLREWHKRIPVYSLRPGTELEFPMGLRFVENLQLIWPT